jgi:hypothetical protein
MRPVPGWVAPGFAIAAIATVPWIAYLALTLPQTVRLYDRTAWIGFDVGLVIMLSLTAFLAWRGQLRVALAAIATATMLVVDAWFDVLTSKHGADLVTALVLAVVELSIAAVCVWIALHAASVVRARIADLGLSDQLGDEPDQR